MTQLKVNQIDLLGWKTTFYFKSLILKIYALIIRIKHRLEICKKESVNCIDWGGKRKEKIIMKELIKNGAHRQMPANHQTGQE